MNFFIDIYFLINSADNKNVGIAYKIVNCIIYNNEELPKLTFLIYVKIVEINKYAIKNIRYLKGVFLYNKTIFL